MLRMRYFYRLNRFLIISLCLLLLIPSLTFPISSFHLNDEAFAEADITAPTVSITSPNNNATVGPSGENVTITANASDAVGVTRVDFYADNVKVGESVYAPYTYNWLATGGRHTVVAQAYDAAGNIGTSSNTILNVPAKVTVTNPVNGNVVSGVLSSLSATFSDPMTEGSADLYIDGQYIKSQFRPDGWTTVTFTYNWDTNQYANGTSHVVEIRGTTQNGSVLSSGTSTVTVDNTSDTIAPAVSITAPANNATVNLGSTVAVNANASDAVGVTKVEFYVNNAKVGESVYAPYTYNWLPTTVGNYTLTAKASDAAGNIGESSPITVTVLSPDTTPPNPTATPLGGTYNAAVNVTLSADEPANIYYTLDGSEPTVASSLYSSPVNISSNKTLKFIAKDTAGNTSVVKTEYYLIDADGPAVSITSPSNGSSVKGTQNIQVEANDSQGISKIDLYIDNSQMSSGSTSPLSYSWDTTAYSEGLHTVASRAI